MRSVAALLMVVQGGLASCDRDEVRSESKQRRTWTERDRRIEERKAFADALETRNRSDGYPTDVETVGETAAVLRVTTPDCSSELADFLLAKIDRALGFVEVQCYTGIEQLWRRRIPGARDIDALPPGG